MPLYEYQCAECGRDFEILRPMPDADAPADCRECGSPRTKRKLSLCFASSGGEPIKGMSSSHSCSGCAGGSCASCGE
jgi:putative FmdB family regulatory protein